MGRQKCKSQLNNLRGASSRVQLVDISVFKVGSSCQEKHAVSYYYNYDDTRTKDTGNDLKRGGKGNKLLVVSTGVKLLVKLVFPKKKELVESGGAAVVVEDIDPLLLCSFSPGMTITVEQFY